MVVTRYSKVNSLKIIDPHIHLIDLAKGQYHWLKPQNPPHWPDKHLIEKNVDEHSLSLSAPLQLAGFVHIEAGFDNQQPWRELLWLEQQCQLPFNAVACADITLTPALFLEQITKLKQCSSLVGIRHILDDQACDILSLPHVNENLQLLAQHQLSFDCQFPFTNNAAVDALDKLLSSIPELDCIINHAGLPPLPSELAAKQRWHDNLRTISAHTNVAIKCSGWEMLDRQYAMTFAHDTINLCLSLFGLSRVMLASNFPLTKFSHSYQDYWQQLTSALPANTLESLCFENALNWYKLKKYSNI